MILALVLCLGTATAFALDLSASPKGDPYEPMAETVTMTIGKSEDTSARYEPNESVDDNWKLRWFEEQLNIDYSNEWTTLNDDAYQQKVALTLAMGDMPDVMTVNELQLRQMVKAGLIEDLTEAAETYAGKELISYWQSGDGIGLESAIFDGKLMAIPNINPGADGIPLLFIRGDWMDKYGLEEPKTLDDIINIVKTFQEKEGSMGLLAQNSIVNVGNNAFGLDALFALFGAYPEMWVTDASGDIAYGSIQPEVKTALTKIRELVETGIIEKNFVVYDQDQCNELATSGKAGIFFAPWWYLNWPLADMTKSDENVYWNVYACPLDESGKYNAHMMAPTTSYAVVRKGYEHPDAVVKTLNLSMMADSRRMPAPMPNEDAYESWQMAPVTLLQCHYNEKEDKARNVVLALEGKKDPSELIAEEIRWYERSVYVNENGAKKALEDNCADGYYFAMGAYPIAKAEDEGILNRVYASTYSKSESMDKKWATLEKLEDETFLQIIAGDKTIDDFDSFVDQWLALGGADITRELIEMNAK